MALKSFDGYVTKEEWNKIIKNNQEKIDNAMTMAYWYSGTYRMCSDLSFVNVVIYEDGEVRILCQYDSEKNNFYILDEDYFKGNRAFICLRRFRKHYPLNDITSFENSYFLKRFISPIIEKYNFVETVNKKIKDIYDGEHASYKELNGIELADIIDINRELYDLVIDHLAYNEAIKYTALGLHDYDSGIKIKVESCSPGISDNKYILRDEINNEVVEEYAQFIDKKI